MQGMHVDAVVAMNLPGHIALNCQCVLVIVHDLLCTLEHHLGDWTEAQTEGLEQAKLLRIAHTCDKLRDSAHGSESTACPVATATATAVAIAIAIVPSSRCRCQCRKQSHSLFNIFSCC
jgi:hypothetical protein